MGTDRRKLVASLQLSIRVEARNNAKWLQKAVLRIMQKVALGSAGWLVGRLPKRNVDGDPYGSVQASLYNLPPMSQAVETMCFRLVSRPYNFASSATLPDGGNPKSRRPHLI